MEKFSFVTFFFVTFCKKKLKKFSINKKIIREHILNYFKNLEGRLFSSFVELNF